MDLGNVPTDKLPEVMQVFFDQVIDTVGPVLEWLSWLLGGIFGLYLLYFLLRLYFDRRRVVLLKEVRGDVEFLKEHSLSSEELSKLRTILNEHPSVKKANGKKKVARKKKSKVSKIKKKLKSPKRKTSK